MFDPPPVITSPGNLALAKKVIRSSNQHLTSRVVTVRDRFALGTGNKRMEIYLVSGGFHVDESLIFYFPSYGIVFEADVSDYYMDAKHFLNVAAQRNLRVQSIYSAHSFGVFTPKDWTSDEPGN
jgi:hypothetical protein